VVQSLIFVALAANTTEPLAISHGLTRIVLTANAQIVRFIGGAGVGACRPEAGYDSR